MLGYHYGTPPPPDQITPQIRRLLKVTIPVKMLKVSDYNRCIYLSRRTYAG